MCVWKGKDKNLLSDRISGLHCYEQLLGRERVRERKKESMQNLIKYIQKTGFVLKVSLSLSSTENTHHAIFISSPPPRCLDWQSGM